MRLSWCSFHGHGAANAHLLDRDSGQCYMALKRYVIAGIAHFKICRVRMVQKGRTNSAHHAFADCLHRSGISYGEAVQGKGPAASERPQVPGQLFESAAERRASRGRADLQRNPW